MKTVLVQSKDLDCGYVYSIHITAEQAEAVLNAQEGDIISLGLDGAWIKVNKDTVLVRSGSSGGTSPLEKRDVLSQIIAQR